MVARGHAVIVLLFLSAYAAAKDDHDPGDDADAVQKYKPAIIIGGILLIMCCQYGLFVCLWGGYQRFIPWYLARKGQNVLQPDFGMPPDTNGWQYELPQYSSPQVELPPPVYTSGSPGYTPEKSPGSPSHKYPPESFGQTPGSPKHTTESFDTNPGPALLTSPPSYESKSGLSTPATISIVEAHTPSSSTLTSTGSYSANRPPSRPLQYPAVAHLSEIERQISVGHSSSDPNSRRSIRVTAIRQKSHEELIARGYF